jgi:hypothetical protein
MEATRGAAMEATRGAAMEATRDAARGVAWGAAWGTAWGAACDTAWSAARGAARVAALYAEFILTSDLKFDDKKKHIKTVNDRWDVWKKGYGVYARVNGVLYVYAKK